MSYDLKVMILGQEKPKNFNSIIDVISESEEELRFQLTWKFVSNLRGVMYSLGKFEGVLFNAMEIVDTNFETPNVYPYWMENEDEISNLTPVKLQKDYNVAFENLIREMIDCSPMNMITFMTRYQGGDKEVICGTMKLNEFLKSINEDKILFNVCYVIEKDEE